jgi:HEAT repeat protein
MIEDLEDVDGIGPTYADRLREDGFESLNDLVEADVDEIAEAADTSESRAEDWIKQAEEMHGTDEADGEGSQENKDSVKEAESEKGGDEESEEEKDEEETEEKDQENEEQDAEESDEDADEEDEGAEGEEEDEEKTTKDKLEDLGFYDNDFTEFPPELSGLKRFKAKKNPEPIIEALQIQGYDTTFMRLEMIEALGRIGDETAVDVLLEEVNDNDTRMEAMDALGRIGSEKATDKILELLDPERKVQPHVRAKAAETAGRLGDPNAVELLVETLGSDSSEVRGTAAEALARIGSDTEDADVVEELATVLDEEADETVRMSAARALRSVGTDEAREVLGEYQNDRNELVAEAASAAQS